MGTAWTKYPRIRHLSVADDKRYVYLIGSTKPSSNKVERYDSEKNIVEEMADLNGFDYKPGHTSSCFFKEG